MIIQVLSELDSTIFRLGTGINPFSMFHSHLPHNERVQLVRINILNTRVVTSHIVSQRYARKREMALRENISKAKFNVAVISPRYSGERTII